ncbi:hypothetical protein [Orenia marismortui]|uniref:Uncharacterized protein n=1 Tax=Orenia marismortui TaxID=46469 RepID=A0A4R8HAP5_9FIRM|nr:hypothetical protein [Orenia marismortui]TDX53005.1 hypothetical protein C7959_104135 [Orenia marismortui]
MRVSKGEVFTSTELMKEFFGMSDRLIYNVPEKMRYQKIYKYLMDNGAQVLSEVKDNKYTILNLKGERYLIPNNIFSENDLKWIEGIKKQEEAKAEKHCISNCRLSLVY